MDHKLKMSLGFWSSLLLTLVNRCEAAKRPGAKDVIDGMSVMIRGHVSWNNWPEWSSAMAPFWADGFTYDFVHPYGKTHGLREWYEGEHLHYNEAFPNFKSANFLSLGEGDGLASLQSYHTAFWNGSFAGVPAPQHKPTIKIKDLDFYILKNKKIQYNWCMVDVVSIMQQGGYEILPPAPLPDGLSYLPPRAMDGIPSPDSNFTRLQDSEIARKVFKQMLEEDFVQQSTAVRSWADNMMWLGPGGIGDAWSSADYAQHFLIPLHEGFPQQSLQIGSSDCEGNYCGALFYLIGTHRGTWLGQAASNRSVRMKFGMHARVDTTHQKIVDAWVQLDVVDAFAQMGIDLLDRAREQARHRGFEIVAEAAPAQTALVLGESTDENVSRVGIWCVFLSSGTALSALLGFRYRQRGAGDSQPLLLA